MRTGVKIVTSWSTLMSLAKDLGQARLSGDFERIKEAERRHDEYRDLCLKADEMVMDLCKQGDL